MEISNEQRDKVIDLCKLIIETDYSSRIGYCIENITKKSPTQSICEKISKKMISDGKYERTRKVGGFDYYISKVHPSKGLRNKHPGIYGLLWAIPTAVLSFLSGWLLLQSKYQEQIQLKANQEQLIKDVNEIQSIVQKHIKDSSIHISKSR